MKKLTTEEFILKARQIHGNLYNYVNSVYTGNKKAVEIICHDHGNFWQKAEKHMAGQKCPRCQQNFKSNTENFILQAEKKHKNKYNYSLVNYTSAIKYVTIICPIHGEFNQTPNNHLSGYGCTKCGKERTAEILKKSTEQFIKEATLIYKNKYDYSKINYKNGHTKIKIICPDHREFFQSPANHLSGHGCPICSASIGEEKIKTWLLNNNITSVSQKSFNDLRTSKRNLLYFDFYLPQYNTCIEYDGAQHYFPVNFSGKITQKEIIKDFLTTKENDKIKNLYCEKTGISLLRIPYTDFDIIEKILENYIKEVDKCRIQQ